MKIIVTAIALALTSTAAMADAPSTSLRPPEVCRKAPIANTNATQWLPQGCNGSVVSGEAEDVAAPTPTPETPQAPAPETPPAPTPDTPAPEPETPDVPNDEDEEGEDKTNASEHNGKGGNDGKGGKDRDGSKNSDKG